MGFSRQGDWSGLPCPPPGDLPNPVIEPRSPALQEDCLGSEAPGEPRNTEVVLHALLQRIFLTQGSNLDLLHWQAGSLPSELPGKPTPPHSPPRLQPFKWVASGNLSHHTASIPYSRQPPLSPAGLHTALSVTLIFLLNASHTSRSYICVCYVCVHRSWEGCVDTSSQISVHALNTGIISPTPFTESGMVGHQGKYKMNSFKVEET